MTDKSSATEKHSNYFYRHWRGELSLGISYWVNSFVGNIVVISFMYLVGAWLEGSLKPSSILFGTIAIYTTVFGIAAWQITGVWRSATKHKETTGRKGWATAAQVMMVIGIFQMVPIAINASKQINEIVKVVEGTDDFAKYKIKLINEKELKIEGYIAFQMVDEVENYFKFNPFINVLRLNSAGGRIAPSRHISKLVTARNMATRTTTLCLSGCTLVFMGGNRRIIDPGAKLGFHQSAMPGMSRSDMRVAELKDKKFLRSRGVPSAFVRKAYGTSNESMWYPSYQELLDNNIVTHVLVKKQLVKLSDYCKKNNCASNHSTPMWLQKTAAEINLILPKKVDWMTRLDSASAGPKNHFSYNYTLTNRTKVNYKIVARNIKNSVCSNQDLEVFFKNGVKLHYRYNDQSGKLKKEITIDRTMCNQHR